MHLQELRITPLAGQVRFQTGEISGVTCLHTKHFSGQLLCSCISSLLFLRRNQVQNSPTLSSAVKEKQRKYWATDINGASLVNTCSGNLCDYLQQIRQVTFLYPTMWQPFTDQTCIKILCWLGWRNDSEAIKQCCSHCKYNLSPCAFNLWLSWNLIVVGFPTVQAPPATFTYQKPFNGQDLPVISLDI